MKKLLLAAISLFSICSGAYAQAASDPGILFTVDARAKIEPMKPIIILIIMNS